VGIFGYSYESIASALTLDALARLRAAGVRARLRLLGAPGADSPSGERWLQQARAAGGAEALEFSGRLPAQELSDELAACEVLLFPDTVGPDSRKSTLAAALAPRAEAGPAARRRRHPASRGQPAAGARRGAVAPPARSDPRPRAGR